MINNSFSYDVWAHGFHLVALSAHGPLVWLPFLLWLLAFWVALESIVKDPNGLDTRGAFQLVLSWSLEESQLMAWVSLSLKSC